MDKLRKLGRKSLIISAILFLFNIYYIAVRNNPVYYSRTYHWISFIGFAVTLITAGYIYYKLKK